METKLNGTANIVRENTHDSVIKRAVLPAGTVIKIGGIPYWLVNETEIRGATPLEAAGMPHVPMLVESHFEDETSNPS